MLLRQARHFLATALIVALPWVASPAAAQTMVRVQTSKGPIDIVLDDASTPNTVANFLGYVRRNQYDGSFFHRLAKNFVLQGGGFRWSDGGSPKLSALTTQSPVINEYSATRPNVRGTVAMAKSGGDANSATSQWFVNLVDNTTTLNESNNGGFTVFGRVTPPSLGVVDQLAAFQVARAVGCRTFGQGIAALTDLPLSPRPDNCDGVNAGNLAMVTAVRELPGAVILSAPDRVFNYLEAAFPQYASPASMDSTSSTSQGYVYRYYRQTNAYVGVRDGQLYYLGPATQNTLLAMGPLADWLAVAAAAGY